MNFSKPDMPISAAMDVISLNYEGQGIREAPEFEGTERIRMAPQYDPFMRNSPTRSSSAARPPPHSAAAGFTSFRYPRRQFHHPGWPGRRFEDYQVSSYGLYSVDFGASPDKVFSIADRHPFVARGICWSGLDHIGEPTPYYELPQRLLGIIDLAGFKKDRFYLYQSRWRPDCQWRTSCRTGPGRNALAR